jgi:hypothetical protein
MGREQLISELREWMRAHTERVRELAVANELKTFHDNCIDSLRSALRDVGLTAGIGTQDVTDLAVKALTAAQSRIEGLEKWCEDHLRIMEVSNQHFREAVDSVGIWPTNDRPGIGGVTDKLKAVIADRDHLRSRLAAAEADAGVMRKALRRAADCFRRIEDTRWGHDGDCGALAIANEGGDIVAATASANLGSELLKTLEKFPRMLELFKQWEDGDGSPTDMFNALHEINEELAPYLPSERKPS